MKKYTNEIVFRGHPDKVCDQISDALLDEYLTGDPFSRCGIEVAGGKNIIFVTGEVTSKTEVEVEKVVRRVMANCGYDPSLYAVINNLGIQSPDIAQGVDNGGAGDQGMVFGYACNDTSYKLPKAQVILQSFAYIYDSLRLQMKDLLPDGKAQITGIYDDEMNIQSIDTFVVSYQNREMDRQYTNKFLKAKIIQLCENYGLQVNNIIFNPTGKFEKGGFEADAGMTGRKIVVDNYHSFANVGGGAFSGKDPTKVDRSGAYMARMMAKATVTSLMLKWCEIQVAYVIGHKQPISIHIDTNKGNLEVSENWYELFEPMNIIDRLKLREPRYYHTAKHGHFGWSDEWEKA